MNQNVSKLIGILEHVATTGEADLPSLERLRRWLCDSCMNRFHKVDLDAMVSVCADANREIVSNKYLKELTIESHALAGLSPQEMADRCIAILLSAPAANTTSLVGLGASKVFEFMDESGLFPEEIRE